MMAGVVDGLFDWLPDAEGSPTIPRKAGGPIAKSRGRSWEVSLVTFPMNPKATVTAVKQMPTDRELEAMLRMKPGFPIRDAKAAVSIFKKTLRDGGETHRARETRTSRPFSRRAERNPRAHPDPEEFTMNYPLKKGGFANARPQ